MNKKRIVFTLLMILLAVFSFNLFGCGDKYANLKVSLSEEVIDLSLDEGGKVDASILATVTGYNENDGVTSDLIAQPSIENPGVCTVSYDAKGQNITRFKIHALKGGSTKVEVMTVQGSKKATFIVNVVKTITSMEILSTYQPVVEVGKSIAISTADAIKFTPQDTTQNKIEYSLAQNYAGVALENGVLSVTSKPANEILINVKNLDNETVTCAPISVRIIQPILESDISFSYSNNTSLEISELLLASNLLSEQTKTINVNVQSNEEYSVSARLSKDGYIKLEQLNNLQFECQSITAGALGVIVRVQINNSNSFVEKTLPARCLQLPSNIKIDGKLINSIADYEIYDTYSTSSYGQPYKIEVGDIGATDKRFYLVLKKDENITTEDQIAVYYADGTRVKLGLAGDKIASGTIIYVKALISGINPKLDVCAYVDAYKNTQVNLVKATMNFTTYVGATEIEAAFYNENNENGSYQIIGKDLEGNDVADELQKFFYVENMPISETYKGARIAYNFTNGAFIKTIIVDVPENDILDVHVTEGSNPEIYLVGKKNGTVQLSLKLPNGIKSQSITVKVYTPISQEAINKGIYLNCVEPNENKNIAKKVMENNSLSYLQLAYGSSLFVDVKTSPADATIYSQTFGASAVEEDGEGNPVYNAESSPVKIANNGYLTATGVGNGVVYSTIYGLSQKTENNAIMYGKVSEVSFENVFSINSFVQVNRIKLNKTYAELYYPESETYNYYDYKAGLHKLQLTLSIFPLNAQENVDIKWVSSDENVTVDNSGLVIVRDCMYISEAETKYVTITAIVTQNNKIYQQTCLIKVLPEIPVDSITLKNVYRDTINGVLENNIYIQALKGDNLYSTSSNVINNLTQEQLDKLTKIEYLCVPANATNQKLVYEIEKKGIVSIREDGYIVPHAAGKTKVYIYAQSWTLYGANPITLKSKDYNKRIELIITVADGTNEDSAIQLRSFNDIVELQQLKIENPLIQFDSLCYKIMNDIRFNPINFTALMPVFSGAIYGNGHTIFGMNLQAIEQNGILQTAVFGEISQKAIIKDLELSGVVLNARKVGSVSSLKAGVIATTNNGTIQNVQVSLQNYKINVTGLTSVYAGGFVSENNNMIGNAIFSETITENTLNSNIEISGQIAFVGTANLSALVVGGFAAVNHKIIAGVNDNFGLANLEMLPSTFVAQNLNLEINIVNTILVSSFSAIGGGVGHNEYFNGICPEVGSNKVLQDMNSKIYCYYGITGQVKVNAPSISNVGGVVGVNDGGQVVNNSISAKINAKENVGGLVGLNMDYYNQTNSTVIKRFVTKNIVELYEEYSQSSRLTAPTAFIQGTENVGGLIGLDLSISSQDETQKSGIFENYVRSYSNYIYVIATGNNAGGLIGQTGTENLNNYYQALNASTALYEKNYTNINVRATNNAGGLIGKIKSSSIISNVFTMGGVVALAQLSTAGRYVGTIESYSQISYSYSNVEIYSNIYSGMLATNCVDNATKNIADYSSEYWSITNDINSFSESIWLINASYNDGYPILVFNGKIAEKLIPNEIIVNITNGISNNNVGVIINNEVIPNNCTDIVIYKEKSVETQINFQDLLVLLNQNGAELNSSTIKFSVTNESVLKVTNNKLILKNTGKTTLIIYCYLRPDVKTQVNIIVVDRLDASNSGVYTEREVENFSKKTEEINLERNDTISLYPRLNASLLTGLGDIFVGYTINKTDYVNYFYNFIANNKIDNNNGTYTIFSNAEEQFITTLENLKNDILVTVQYYVLINGNYVLLDNTSLNDSPQIITINIKSGASNISASISSLELNLTDEVTFEVICYTDNEEDKIKLNINSDTITVTKLDFEYNPSNKTLKNTYLVKFNEKYTQTSNPEFSFYQEQEIIELMFSAQSNYLVATRILINTKPQKVLNINATHYAASQKIIKNGEAYYYPNELPSTTITPGQYGLLTIDMYPEYANYDCLELIGTSASGHKISFVQTVQSEITEDSQKTIFIELKPAANQITNGVELRRVSTAIIENSKIASTSFNGTIYANTIISSNVPAGTIFNIVIRAYNKDINGNIIQSSICTSNNLHLTVVARPGIYIQDEFDEHREIRLDEETIAHAVARGINVNIKSTLIDFVGIPQYSISAYILNSDNQRVDLSSYYDTLINSKSDKLYNLVATKYATTESYRNYIKAFYVLDAQATNEDYIFQAYQEIAKSYYLTPSYNNGVLTIPFAVPNGTIITLKASVSRYINGIKEESTSTLTFVVTDFVITGVSIKNASLNQINLMVNKKVVLQSNLITENSSKDYEYGEYAKFSKLKLYADQKILQTFENDYGHFHFLSDSYDMILDVLESNFGVIDTEIKDIENTVNKNSNLIVDNNGTSVNYNVWLAYRNGVIPYNREGVTLTEDFEPTTKNYKVTLCKGAEDGFSDNLLDYYLIDSKKVSQSNWFTLNLPFDYFAESVGNYVKYSVKLPSNFENNTFITNKSFTFDFNVKISVSTEEENFINNEDQFLNMQNDLHYVLTKDLDLSTIYNNQTNTEFTPIDVSFANFDGRGHSIKLPSTITVSSKSEDATNVGLFANISTTSTLKNLTIIVPKTLTIKVYETEFNVGILAGTNNGVITNCSILVDNSETNILNADYNNVFVSTINVNAIQSGTLTPLGSVTNATVGGLVGINTGYITNSKVNANYYDIEIENQDISEPITNRILIINAGSRIGGFAGLNSGTITSCYAVNTKVKNTATAISNTKTGGFIAENSSNGKISFSFAENTLLDYDEEQISSIISGLTYEQLLSKTAIESLGSVGGFVHTNYGYIYNNYSSVTMKTSNRSGGFVYTNLSDGYVGYSYSVSKAVDVLDSTAHTPFTGTNDLSEVNYVEGKNAIEYSYYIGNNSIKDYDTLYREPAIQITEAYFTDITKFIGFDFGIGTSVANGGTWYMSTELKRPILVDSRRVTDVNAPTHNQSNPYLITTANEFLKTILTNTVEIQNQKYFTESIRIVKDLDFNQVIGDEQIMQIQQVIFAGFLDGNNLSISNLRILGSESTDTSLSFGLFKQIGKENSNTVFKNISINVIEMTKTRATSVGVLSGEIINTRLANIHIKGENITASGYNMVGAVAGRISGESSMFNITSNLSVNAGYVSIVDEKSYSPTSPTTIATEYVSKYDVNYNASIDKQISYAGGLVGVVDIFFGSDSLDTESNITDVNYDDMQYICNLMYVSGSLKISAEYVGGIFGYSGMFNLVYNAKFELNLTSSSQLLSGKFATGGLIAQNFGKLTYSRVEVKDSIVDAVDSTLDNATPQTLFKNDGYHQVYIGGLVGLNEGGIIENSFNKAHVVNMDSDYTGGIVGYAGFRTRVKAIQNNKYIEFTNEDLFPINNLDNTKYTEENAIGSKIKSVYATGLVFGGTNYSFYKAIIDANSGTPTPKPTGFKLEENLLQNSNEKYDFIGIPQNKVGGIVGYLSVNSTTRVEKNIGINDWKKSSSFENKFRLNTAIYYNGILTKTEDNYRTTENGTRIKNLDSDTYIYYQPSVGMFAADINYTNNCKYAIGFNVESEQAGEANEEIVMSNYMNYSANEKTTSDTVRIFVIKNLALSVSNPILFKTDVPALTYNVKDSVTGDTICEEKDTRQVYQSNDITAPYYSARLQIKQSIYRNWNELVWDKATSNTYPKLIFNLPDNIVQIYTESNLTEVFNSDRIYLLMNDIYLTSYWNPIEGFSGVLTSYGSITGDRFTIYNINIASTTSQSAGFFATTSVNACIKNVNFVYGSYIFNDSMLENKNNAGNRIITSEQDFVSGWPKINNETELYKGIKIIYGNKKINDQYAVGSLIGVAGDGTTINNVDIIYSDNTTITTNAENIGGVVGRAPDGVSMMNVNFNKCYDTYSYNNAFQVEDDFILRPSAISTDRDLHIGGAIGYVYNSISEDYLTQIDINADIIVLDVSQAISYNCYVGGIIGYANDMETSGQGCGMKILSCKYKGLINVNSNFNKTYIGGIAGLANKLSLYISNSIDNVIINAKMVKENSSLYLGAQMGYLNATKLETREYSTELNEVKNSTINVINSSAIGAGYNIGGFVGYLKDSSIEKAMVSNETVINTNTTNASNFSIGGFIGTIENSLPSIKDYIYYCYADAIITDESTLVSDSFAVGGFVGKLTDDALEGGVNPQEIDYCAASGNIYQNSDNSATKKGIGGFVGLLDSRNASINHSSSTTNIVVSNAITNFKINIGGFVGNNLTQNVGENNTIQNSYSFGDITCKSLSAGTNVGGFIGYTQNSNLTNNYCVSIIKTSSLSNKIGGFCGYANNSNRLTKCLYDYNIALIAYNGFGIPVRTDEIKSEFSIIYQIDSVSEGNLYAYPILYKEQIGAEKLNIKEHNIHLKTLFNLTSGSKIRPISLDTNTTTLQAGNFYILNNNLTITNPLTINGFLNGNGYSILNKLSSSAISSISSTGTVAGLTVVNSVSINNSNQTNLSISGFANDNSGTIFSCFASGKITLVSNSNNSNTNNIFGFVGTNNGLISNVGNNTNISTYLSTETSTVASTNFGILTGFVGTNNGYIYNTYTTGKISNKLNTVIRSLCGFGYDNGTSGVIDNIYSASYLDVDEINVVDYNGLFEIWQGISSGRAIYDCVAFYNVLVKQSEDPRENTTYEVFNRFTPSEENNISSYIWLQIDKFNYGYPSIRDYASIEDIELENAISIGSAYSNTGDGTAQNPILINHAGTFEYIRTKLNKTGDLYYKQTENLDFSIFKNEDIPNSIYYIPMYDFGSDDTNNGIFQRTAPGNTLSIHYNGNGKVVDGLVFSPNYIASKTDENEVFVGLFGKVNTIENLGVSASLNYNSLVNLSNKTINIGTICSKLTSGSISNCWAKVNYQINSCDGLTTVLGALCANTTNSDSISSSFTTGEITFANFTAINDNLTISGFIGNSNNTTINSCYTTVSIKQTKEIITRIKSELNTPTIKLSAIADGSYIGSVDYDKNISLLTNNEALASSEQTFVSNAISNASAKESFESIKKDYTDSVYDQYQALLSEVTNLINSRNTFSTAITNLSNNLVNIYNLRGSVNADLDYALTKLNDVYQNMNNYNTLLTQLKSDYPIYDASVFDSIRCYDCIVPFSSLYVSLDDCYVRIPYKTLENGETIEHTDYILISELGDQIASINAQGNIINDENNNLIVVHDNNGEQVYSITNDLTIHLSNGVYGKNLDDEYILIGVYEENTETNVKTIKLINNTSTILEQSKYFSAQVYFNKVVSFIDVILYNDNFEIFNRGNKTNHIDANSDGIKDAFSASIQIPYYDQENGYYYTGAECYINNSDCDAATNYYYATNSNLYNKFMYNTVYKNIIEDLYKKLYGSDSLSVSIYIKAAQYNLTNLNLQVNNFNSEFQTIYNGIDGAKLQANSVIEKLNSLSKAIKNNKTRIDDFISTLGGSNTNEKQKLQTISNNLAVQLELINKLLNGATNEQLQLVKYESILDNISDCAKDINVNVAKAITDSSNKLNTALNCFTDGTSNSHAIYDPNLYDDSYTGSSELNGFWLAKAKLDELITGTDGLINKAINDSAGSLINALQSQDDEKYRIKILSDWNVFDDLEISNNVLQSKAIQAIINVNSGLFNTQNINDIKSKYIKTKYFNSPEEVDTGDATLISLSQGSEVYRNLFNNQINVTIGQEANQVSINVYSDAKHVLEYIYNGRVNKYEMNPTYYKDQDYLIFNGNYILGIKDYPGAPDTYYEVVDHKAYLKNGEIFSEISNGTIPEDAYYLCVDGIYRQKDCSQNDFEMVVGEYEGGTPITKTVSPVDVFYEYYPSFYDMVNESVIVLSNYEYESLLQTYIDAINNANAKISQISLEADPFTQISFENPSPTMTISVGTDDLFVHTFIAETYTREEDGQILTAKFKFAVQKVFDLNNKAKAILESEAIGSKMNMSILNNTNNISNYTGKYYIARATASNPTQQLTNCFIYYISSNMYISAADNCIITGASASSTIVGNAYRCYIYNCKLSMDSYLKSMSVQSSGGLINYLNYSIVYKCGAKINNINYQDDAINSTNSGILIGSASQSFICNANMLIDDSSIRLSNNVKYFGGLVGKLDNSTLCYSNFSCSSENLTIILGSITSEKNIGALIGTMISSTCYESNCLVNINYTLAYLSSNLYIGGLVGNLSSGDLTLIPTTDINRDLKVTSTDLYCSSNNYSIYVGGTIGKMTGGTINSMLTNAILIDNDVLVYLIKNKSKSINGKDYVGGLIGYCSDGTINNIILSNNVIGYSLINENYVSDTTAYSASNSGNTNITDSTPNAIVSDKNWYAGASWGCPTNSYVLFNEIDVLYVGGIIGHLNGTPEFENVIRNNAQIFAIGSESYYELTTDVWCAVAWFPFVWRWGGIIYSTHYETRLSYAGGIYGRGTETLINMPGLTNNTSIFDSNYITSLVANAKEWNKNIGINYGNTGDGALSRSGSIKGKDLKLESGVNGVLACVYNYLRNGEMHNDTCAHYWYQNVCYHQYFRLGVRLGMNNEINQDLIRTFSKTGGYSNDS